MEIKGSYQKKMFEERTGDRIEEANADHAGFSNALLNSGREGCGETTGRRQRDREHSGGMRKYS